MIRMKNLNKILNRLFETKGRVNFSLYNIIFEAGEKESTSSSEVSNETSSSPSASSPSENETSNEEALVRLSEIENFSDRLNFARERFTKLSGQVTYGTSREIFNFSDDEILKVAKDPAGIRQITNEIRVNKNEEYRSIVQRYLTQITRSDPDGKWIVTEKVRPFRSPEEFASRLGIRFPLFAHIIYTYWHNRFYIHGPGLTSDEFIHAYIKNMEKTENVDQIANNRGLIELIESLMKLINDRMIGAGDLVNSLAYAHFGTSVRDGKIKIYDYGENPNRIKGLPAINPAAQRIEDDYDELESMDRPELERREIIITGRPQTGTQPLPSVEEQERIIADRQAGAAAARPAAPATTRATTSGPVRGGPVRGASLFRPLPDAARDRRR